MNEGTKLHAVSGNNTGLPECPTCHGEGVLAHEPKKRMRVGKLVLVMLSDIEKVLAPSLATSEAPGIAYVGVLAFGSAGLGLLGWLHDPPSPWWLKAVAPFAFLCSSWVLIAIKRWLKSAIERSRA